MMTTIQQTIFARKQLWTLVMLSCILSTSGCARLFHAANYNSPIGWFAERHRPYVHPGSTGRIIAKEGCYCPEEPGCFGYEPTCWNRWPEYCPNCPMEEESVVSEEIVPLDATHGHSVSEQPGEVPTPADENPLPDDLDDGLDPLPREELDDLPTGDGEDGLSPLDDQAEKPLEIKPIPAVANRELRTQTPAANKAEPIRSEAIRVYPAEISNRPPAPTDIQAVESSDITVQQSSRRPHKPIYVEPTVTVDPVVESQPSTIELSPSEIVAEPSKTTVSEVSSAPIELPMETRVGSIEMEASVTDIKTQETNELRVLGDLEVVRIPEGEATAVATSQPLATPVTSKLQEVEASVGEASLEDWKPSSRSLQPVVVQPKKLVANQEVVLEKPKTLEGFVTEAVAKAEEIDVESTSLKLVDDLTPVSTSTPEKLSGEAKTKVKFLQTASEEAVQKTIRTTSSDKSTIRFR